MKQKLSDLESFRWRFHYPNDKIYSCKDAATLLKLPLEEIYILRKTGAIPFLLIQGMYFFEKHDLIKWIIDNHPEKMINKSQSTRNILRAVQYYLNLLILFLK